MSRRDPDNQAPKERSSPDSDSNKSSSVAGSKRRASRAGTRSVSNLSQAQLDRKRANDREAQRAIRQRTRDRIESLEKKIAELTEHTEPSDHLVVALKRTKELEEENASLRAKLEQSGINFSPTDRTGSWDDMATTRPLPLHMPDSSMQLSGQQQQDARDLMGRRGSQEQASSYAYRQVPQWQTTSPFRAEQAIKSEGTPSPDAQISSQGYSPWPTDRRPGGSQSRRTDVRQPVVYSQIMVSQPYTVPSTPVPSQVGMHLPMQPPGLPSYEPTQERYMQHVQSQQQHVQQSQQDISQSAPSPSPTGSQQVFYGNFQQPR